MNIFSAGGLQPHCEVPEILYHLLLPSYFKLAIALFDLVEDSENDPGFDALLSAYRSVNLVFGACGGWLLAEIPPDTLEHQSDRIASACVIGQDVPLVEISRMLGYIYGSTRREVPECYITFLPDQMPAIHADWITAILTHVGEDWDIKSWSRKGN